MKILSFILMTLTLAQACNKRVKSHGTGSPDKTSADQGSASDSSSGDSSTAIDTRPVAATVSTQTFSCESLDYGLYWFGTGDVAQKPSESQRSSFFDPKKPTLIYVHGWQAGSHSLERRATFNYSKTDPIYGIKVNGADAWIAAGWNVGIFYWNQISDETAPASVEDKIWGDSAVTWKDCQGKDTAVPGNPASALDLFYANYLLAMQGYSGNHIRIAGHSAGQQLVVRLADKLVSDARLGKIDSKLVPKRVALLDPWWSNTTATQSRAGDVRALIQGMKAKGLIFEWYKTSTVNDNAKSDANAELVPVIGRTDLAPDYYSSLNQASRHMAAPFLYVLSFASPAPKGCVLPCTELAPSAATADDRMLELMGKAVEWEQVLGRETPDPSDNTFEKLTP